MKSKWLRSILCLHVVFPMVARGAEPQTIEIATTHSVLTLFVAKDNRVYQLGYGKAGRALAIPQKTPDRLTEFYPQAGDGFICEPALQVTHHDGNTSTDLEYVNSKVTALDTNVSLARIE